DLDGEPEWRTRLHVDDLIFRPDKPFKTGGEVVREVLYFTADWVGRPPEIECLVLGGNQLVPPEPEPQFVTDMNDAMLSQFDMQPLESFTFKGANDEE